MLRRQPSSQPQSDVPLESIQQGDLKLLLAPSQVARMMSMSARQLNRLVDSGGLPVAARTPGGHRRYALSDVLRVMRQDSNGADSGVRR